MEKQEQIVSSRDMKNQGFSGTMKEWALFS